MKQKKSVQEKVREDYKEFANEVANLTPEQLSERISGLAKHSEEVTDAKNADEALSAAREEVGQLAAPYRDAQKAIKLKIRYCYELIGERGSS